MLIGEDNWIKTFVEPPLPTTIVPSAMVRVLRTILSKQANLAAGFARAEGESQSASARLGWEPYNLAATA